MNHDLSIFPFTALETPITSSLPSLNAGGDYIAGIDMMKIDGWHIHDNTFKNILGCDRAIAFGNPSGPVSDMFSLGPPPIP